LGGTDLKECVSCGTGLLAVSDICPQCGWQKNKLDESDESEKIVQDKLVKEVKNKPKKKKEPLKDTKNKIIEEIKFENRVPRPFGIKLLSSFLIYDGIFMAIFGVIFGITSLLFVISSVMNFLDTSTMSLLGMIIDFNEMTGSPSANEMVSRMNASDILSVNAMMDILSEISVIAIIEAGIGISMFFVGKSLVKRKKWARMAIIVTAIVSVPLVVLVVDGIDNLIVLGMAAFDGVVLYYMFKPKVREYFSQTSKSSSDKKSKQKTN
jgi:hypothetical protein